MIAEYTITTPPFLTFFKTVISHSGEHIFIDDFNFQVESHLFSEPSQRSILGTYIIDLEREKLETSLQDTEQNSAIFEHELNIKNNSQIIVENKIIQSLRQNPPIYRVLNGPEFFSGYSAYLVRLQDSDFFIAGCAENSAAAPFIKIEIPKNSYDNHTQKILNTLKSTLRNKHHDDFVEFMKSHEDSKFLSIETTTQIPDKTIRKIIKYLCEKNLIINSSRKKNNLEELKYSDLNELGWALSVFMEKKWLHTKTLKSGNADFNILDKEIEVIRKRLEFN